MGKNPHILLAGNVAYVDRDDLLDAEEKNRAGVVTVANCLLVQFPDAESLREAIQSGQIGQMIFGSEEA